MSGEEHSGRTVLAIEGEDRIDFLQGLVTNDVSKLSDGIAYAALLTPQGKYLADFFLVGDGERILLDVASELAPGLAKRLAMYKLRAKVAIHETGLHVQRGTGPAPDGAHPDPRHPELGWRLYTQEAGTPQSIDWDAIRVRHCIPETGVELMPNDTFILEAGFERLRGVDFRKGCYVGQEVTARMKHKTELRKGFATVTVEGPPPPPGSEIMHDGKPAGTLYTTAGGQGIAYLRFDRAGTAMTAGDARIGYEPAPTGG